MGIVGWPIESAQKLAGLGPLPYLFLLPNLLVFGIYTFAPFFINIGFSATEGQSILFSERDWGGAANFNRLFSDIQPDTGGRNLEDDKFYRSVMDTAVFVVFQVPIMVFFALLTALVLNREIVGRGFWRSVFFYPVMLSPVVVGFLWTLILKRQGVLSLTLIEWGWIDEPIQWLTDPAWTMFWSVFVYTWAHLGFYMLILLAGLQAIPKDLYEAAQMDGTSDWRMLWRITLPLLMPTLLVVTVLSLIKAFQAFEELYAMQVGWISIVSYIFESSGLRGQPTAHGLGIAATASLVVAVFLALLSLGQIALSGRRSWQ
ncbi:MAG: sugar ABC transporter permease [Ectothiorhodospiraceae bacterium AqS1]|nr:sugar ABC transporter permease [Ectothiorhodospiraceae bacterium AqS1]